MSKHTNEDANTPDVVDATTESNDDQAELRVEKSDKKTKVSFDAHMGREEAVSYFEAIVAGLKSGTIQFRQGEESLTLDVGDQVAVAVKAQRKGEKGKVTFELSWREGGPGLSIVPEA